MHVRAGEIVARATCTLTFSLTCGCSGSPDIRLESSVELSFNPVAMAMTWSGEPTTLSPHPLTANKSRHFH